MNRYVYNTIKSEFVDNGNSVLLYGPAGIGKSHLLRQLAAGLKNYVLIDLQIDREFTDGLLAVINQNGSVCDYIASFFGFERNRVKNDSYFFLDGIEVLKSSAKQLHLMDLPRHIAFSTSRIDFTGCFLDGRINKHILFKLRPFSFYEFLELLTENGFPEYVSVLKAHYERRIPLPELIEEEISELFHDYLLVGGYPEAILQYIQDRASVSDIRRVQEKLFATILLRLSDNLPKDVSPVRLNQIISYCRTHAADNRGSFHPGHIRKGAVAEEFRPEITYLQQNGILLTVNDANNSLSRFEIADCGLLRYLANDYDAFYLLDSDGKLPEYFYQNYMYTFLEAENKKIRFWKNGRTQYIPYYDSNVALRHSYSEKIPEYESFWISEDRKSVTIYNVMDMYQKVKTADHNIKYYFLEQTQF